MPCRLWLVLRLCCPECANRSIGLVYDNLHAPAPPQAQSFAADLTVARHLRVRDAGLSSTAALVAGVRSYGVHAPTYTLIDLGILQGAGYYNEGSAINDLGDAVGGSGNNACLGHRGNLINVGALLPSNYFNSAGSTNLGQVVGTLQGNRADVVVSHVALRQPTRQITDLGTFGGTETPIAGS